MTPDPATLPGSMTVPDAARFFADRATHRSYPVVDEDGRLLGLASRSDALRWHVEGGPIDATLGGALSDASQPVAWPDSPIGDVADLMVDTGVGRIPIVDQASGQVVGILSRHDLLKARSVRREAELDRSNMRRS